MFHGLENLISLFDQILYEYESQMLQIFMFLYPAQPSDGQHSLCGISDQGRVKMTPMYVLLMKRETKMKLGTHMVYCPPFRNESCERKPKKVLERSSHEPRVDKW